MRDGISRSNGDSRAQRMSAYAILQKSLKVDVIVSINTPPSLAAKRATQTTPIVIARVSDPVRTGLVASFARPREKHHRTEQLFRRTEWQAVGADQRTDSCGFAVSGAIGLSVREMERASSPFGVHLQVHGVKSADEFRSAFQAIMRERASALFVFDDVLMTTRKRQILDWAAEVRLPVISQYAEIAEAGGLIAYGPNIPEIYRRTATYVDKILKGAEPSDLPVEQPTKVELVINLKTAKALGLTIPQSLLQRADQVIE
jgi:putative ABC transport system substrate-binding protein